MKRCTAPQLLGSAVFALAATLAWAQVTPGKQTTPQAQPARQAAPQAQPAKQAAPQAQPPKQVAPQAQQVKQVTPPAQPAKQTPAPAQVTQAAAQATQVRAEIVKAALHAGSVVEGGKPAVLLLWSLEEGWFPAEGLRLVRIAPGSAPVILSGPTGFKPEARLATAESLATASRKLSKALPPPAALPKQSTRAIFDSASASARSALQGKKAVDTQVIRKTIAEAPAVSGFYSKLKKEAPQLRSATLDPDAATVEARSKLMLTAALNPVFAGQLGLRYLDTGVSPGQKVRYELRVMVNGADTLLSSAEVTVGQDRNTTTPLAAPPMQVGQAHLQFHFELPPGTPDTSWTFNIYRGANASGQPLNKDPILPTFTATTSQTLAAALVSFEDKSAPLGQVSYAVVTQDMFGRLGPPVVLQAEVLDIAGPSESKAAFGLRTNAPATQLQRVERGAVRPPGPSNVRILWVPSDRISDATPFTPAAVGYRVERYDTEVANPPAVVLQALAAGTPVNLATIDVRTLCKLRPDWQAWLDRVRQTALANSGRGDGTNRVDPAALVEEIYGTRVAAYLQATPSVPAELRAISLLEITDPTPPADRYVRYAVTPILRRNQRESVPTQTNIVGIPATALPGLPVLGATRDDPAPIAGAALQALAATGNVSSALNIQKAPGLRGPVAGTIAEGQQTRLVVNQSKAPTTRSTIPTPKGGVPVNYGRKVTLTWSAPAYSSAVQYKVFRANGTGFRAGPAAAAAPAAGGPPVNAVAEKSMVKASASVSAQAKGTSVAVQTKGTLVASQRQLKAAVKPFKLDDTPPAEEFLQVGLTKPGATQFVDLLPVSQSNTYYYYLLPVNRWGTTGPASAHAKIKVKPSMPPSVPTLLGAFAQGDGSIRVQVSPNLEVEDVATYRVHRLEVPVPASPPPPPQKGPAQIVRKAANLPAAAAKGGQQSSSPFAQIAVNQGALAATALPPALSRVFDLASYTKIQVQVDGKDDDGRLRFKDLSAQPGKYYAYRVVAVNSANLVSEPSQHLDAGAIRISASPPTAAGAYNPAGEKIMLSLTPPPSGADSYIIERAVGSPATAWTKLGVIPVASQFEDSVIQPGRTYNYRVSTVDSSGNISPPSLAVSVSVP